MSFPHFPNPARRAKILHTHQLRQQGLTLRQIAEIMNCAHSTVAGYLSDFELFRTDLIQELAADQIVSHVIQLADLADEHHDRRLAAVRELRLLLGAVPKIRYDEYQRVGVLTQAGVSVDRYGNRHPMLNRIYPPTPQESAKLEQNAHLPAQTELDPDLPLAVTPDRRPPPVGEAPRSGGGGLLTDSQPTDSIANDAHRAPPSPPPSGDPLPSPADQPALPARTNPNNTEQESTPNPAHNGKSSHTDQNSPPPTKQPPQPVPDLIEDPFGSPVPPDIRDFLQHSTRDWLNDYPPHNPDHPLHQAALQLKAEKETAALASTARDDP